MTSEENPPSAGTQAESTVPEFDFDKEKSSQGHLSEDAGSHAKHPSPVANGKPENSAKEDSFSLHSLATRSQGETLNQKHELSGPSPGGASKSVLPPSEVHSRETDRPGMSENEEGQVVDPSDRELSAVEPSSSVSEDKSQKAKQTEDRAPRDGEKEEHVHFAETEEIISRSGGLEETTALPEETSDKSAAGTSGAAAENAALVTPLPKAKKSALNKVPTIRSNEEDLKTKIVIPAYLSKGMVNAVESAGAAEIDQSQSEGARAPACPILVFINSKSGGRLGPQLETLLVDLIAPTQVFDLSKCVPEDVLTFALGRLEKLADAGDKAALETRNNLRIVVAGGDGTVGWVLGSIAKVESKRHFTIPPVSVIPLGTGNDLSRSFRWGGATTSISRSGVKKYLRRTIEAEPVIVKPAPTQTDKPLKLPHAMAPQHHISLGDSEGNAPETKASPFFKGYFWNYFSVVTLREEEKADASVILTGLDAQVTHGFHNLRNEAPWLASGRISNQMVYSGYGCAQGWFCTPCAAVPVARGLRQILKMHIKKSQDHGAQWEELGVPPDTRGIVILNLQSYAGGRNIWGRPSSNRCEKEGLVQAKSNDGVLEIIRLRGGWHTAFVLLELRTADRLGQASAIKLEFRGVPKRSEAYMQMDGEPWQQHLGEEDDPPAVVEITCNPTQSRVLLRN